MSWDELARSARRPCTRRPARSQVVDLDLVQVIPGSRARRPGADGALRPGRQPDGARRHRRGRARRGARADDAGAAAGRARRRAARDAGAGAAASRRCSSTPPSATSRSCASSASRSGRAGCACSGAEKKTPGTIGEPVEVGGATIRQGDARRARRRRRRRRRAGARRGGAGRGRASAPSARSRSGRSSRRARSPTTSTACGSWWRSDEPLHDVARIGHAELLTPKPEESLRFFVDVLGMEEEAREGQSVYLRGWGDYLRYSLKLTESPQAGPRPRRAARLEPRGARAPRRRDRGDRPRPRLDRRRRRPRAAPTASRTPTATSSSSTTRPSATSRPST